MKLIDNLHKICGALLLALLLLPSCSNEDPIDDPQYPDPEKTNFYLALNINFPNMLGTRTPTGPNGDSDDLAAIDNENKVEKVTLYFFEDKDNFEGNLLCQFTTTASKDPLIKGGSGTNITLTQKVSIEDLKSIFGKKVNIYAFANFEPSDSYTVETTKEKDFLGGTFSEDGSTRKYVKPFVETTTSEGEGGEPEPITTYGMVCPMANYAQFTVDLSGMTLTGSESDGEIIIMAQELFSGTYTEGGANGKLWKVKDKDGVTALTLERMVARLDYKDGSTIGNHTYKLDKHQASIDACNTGGGVMLKVNNITLKNIGSQAYNFRHTSLGGKDNATVTAVTPFNIEHGNAHYGQPVTDENGEEGEAGEGVNEEEDETGEGGNGEEVEKDYNYRWVADTDWPTTTGGTTWTKSKLLSFYPTATAQSITDLRLPSDYENGGYKPWYYLMENTVPSTDDMSTSNCTMLEFEVVLCDADGNIYKTTEELPEVRITNTDTQKYKVLSFKETDPETGEGYYFMTYNYLIPHNVSASSTGVNGGTGKEGDLNPMHYGIVRNNVYQLSLTGIKNLPDSQEPDNFYLSVEIRVLAWTRRDITVGF